MLHFQSTGLAYVNLVKPFIYPKFIRLCSLDIKTGSNSERSISVTINARRESIQSFGGITWIKQVCSKIQAQMTGQY
jgi:hypothetical protein